MKFMLSMIISLLSFFLRLAQHARSKTIEGNQVNDSIPVVPQEAFDIYPHIERSF